MKKKISIHFENHSSVIRGELLKARHSVFIAVAWINFRVYGDLFEELLSRNIILHIQCTDNRANRSHQAVIDRLIAGGAKIRLLKMPGSTNHMHHKFAVVDKRTILNGSFNWSPNATKSFENLMVLEDCTLEAGKFIDEFYRLAKSTTSSIRLLQKKVRCREKGCGGERFNMLVFAERSSKYHELTGDIISVCGSCYNYSSVKEYIVDNQLSILLDEYRGAGSEEDALELDFSISRQLENYMDGQEIIHAIGRVSTGLDRFDNDVLETTVLWKNVFVGDRLPESFDEENFDVLYENKYYL